MRAQESPVVSNLAGKSEIPADAIDLTGYPHLAYAPSQWGQGVRIARNGMSVADVVATANMVPVGNPSVVGAIDQLEYLTGLTWGELFDALRYTKANGMI
jgi:hypothetical protein